MSRKILIHKGKIIKDKDSILAAPENAAYYDDGDAMVWGGPNTPYSKIEEGINLTSESEGGAKNE